MSGGITEWRRIVYLPCNYGNSHRLMTIHSHDGLWRMVGMDVVLGGALVMQSG